MKSFGFLSFGHYQLGQERASLRQALDLAIGADELGVNGAYFRVHHYAPQAASPMPLLGAIIGATKHIEVGTAVIDMRYENPLHLAEEAAALNLLGENRLALGLSRGSPEPAEKGWESFGYTDASNNDPEASGMAREKFQRFLKAISGEPMSVASNNQYPRLYQPGTPLPIFPHDPELPKHIWWGSGSHKTAVQAAHDGVNLMSSTLVEESTGQSLSDLQSSQIAAFRQEWKLAGHQWTPRVSVSRTVFPIVSAQDKELFGNQAEQHDSVGELGNTLTTFGRTYAAPPDILIEQLKADKAVMSADTLMLTIPNTLGTEINLSILESFARYIAPELGWQPNSAGLTTGYAL